MKNSSQFYILIVAILTLLSSQAQAHPILHKIRHTQQLINLYQNKLNLLMKLAKQQNLTIDFDSNDTEIIRKDNFGGLFKLEEQILFEVDLGLGDPLFSNARFVYPGFIVSGNRIIEMKSREVKGELKGEIVSVQPFQITTRLDEKTVRITKLGEAITSNDLKMQIKNQLGKWHHATKFQDIFLQIQEQNLMLTTTTESSIHKLKSQLLYIQTIHQYKLLYITRYSYGFLNPKSMQITGETMFDSIVETGFYTKPDGMLFVLFKNHTLSLIVQDKVVGSVNVGIEIGLRLGVGLEYVGRYLFVFGSDTPSFNVYQVLPDHSVRHIKQLNLPISFKQCTQTAPSQCTGFPIKYRHQFFKYENQYKLLLSDTQTESKLFNINLQQTQIPQQRNFPWKFVLIIVCLIAVVYFRSKNKAKDGEEDEIEGERKRVVKKIKKQKQKPRTDNRENVGEDYVRELSEQIKRINSTKKHS